jgi:hypothetical protein
MEEAHIGSEIRLTQVLTMRDLSKFEQVQSSNFSPQITGDKNIAQKAKISKLKQPCWFRIHLNLTNPQLTKLLKTRTVIIVGY